MNLLVWESMQITSGEKFAFECWKVLYEIRANTFVHGSVRAVPHNAVDKKFKAPILFVVKQCFSRRSDDRSIERFQQRSALRVVFQQG